MQANYLETFTLPIDREEALCAQRRIETGGCVTMGYIENAYPCCIFDQKELRTVCCKPITIFYGGNGSGKSTLLNLIAAKLQLKRLAPFNSGELFDRYADLCSYTVGCDEDGDQQRIPNGSRILTSDDVFEYMLAMRSNNDEIREKIEIGRAERKRLKYGDTVKLNGMEDYEQYRLQVLARRKSVSARKFLHQAVGKEANLGSNGETALRFFEEKLKNDTLYCLDEPENSMAPKMQIELAAMLEQMARYCGCQFLIATHSPFLLAMGGARIYDLDETPVTIKNWWELENTRVYFSFFRKYKHLFDEDDL